MNKVVPRGGNAIMGIRAVAGIGRSSRSIRLGMKKVVPRGGNAIMGMRAVAGIGRSSRSQHIPIKTRTYIHLDKL